ncbi:hypothetical protein NQ317_002581 [Molorchus minor]|uniref:Ankyrin repeat domain-containing protein 49 n=1 Tax=Molorchus minor TaxID=1323400 RepID=A0ABQ9JTZ7_9CUCU|nr:hypothetical protein NQ317_002581 [Molorchus minor]
MSDERFLVSGWEDDLDDIDETRNPEDNLQNGILEASEMGNLEVIKTLLEKDPGLINATDKDKYTPLHRACYSNHIEVVKYLIQCGADIGAKTDMQWEPLHSCCQWNNKECALILIQKRCRYQTPLHIAASHGVSHETVQLLLMHPYIDPTIKNNSGETAADIARRCSRYYNIFDMVPEMNRKLKDVSDTIVPFKT